MFQYRTTHHLTNELKFTAIGFPNLFFHRRNSLLADNLNSILAILCYLKREFLQTYSMLTYSPPNPHLPTLLLKKLEFGAPLLEQQSHLQDDSCPQAPILRSSVQKYLHPCHCVRAQLAISATRTLTNNIAPFCCLLSASSFAIRSSSSNTFSSSAISLLLPSPSLRPQAQISRNQPLQILAIMNPWRLTIYDYLSQSHTIAKHTTRKSQSDNAITHTLRQELSPSRWRTERNNCRYANWKTTTRDLLV